MHPGLRSRLPRSSVYGRARRGPLRAEIARGRDRFRLLPSRNRHRGRRSNAPRPSSTSTFAPSSDELSDARGSNRSTALAGQVFFAGKYPHQAINSFFGDSAETRQPSVREGNQFIELANTVVSNSQGVFTSATQGRSWSFSAGSFEAVATWVAEHSLTEISPAIKLVEPSK